MDTNVCIDIVKARIKYLEELSVSMPVNRAYITLNRLEESKAILKLLESENCLKSNSHSFN